MFNTTKVIIGIQARSSRDNILHEKIDDKTVLEHTISNAWESACHINAYLKKDSIYVEVALLFPEGDQLAEDYKRDEVILGDKDDLLSRYYKLLKEKPADFIVRICGNCPLIPSTVITRHINIATKNHNDYTFNVDEEFRTSINGIDVEVLSNRMIEWLNDNVEAKEDRAHVTTYLRRNPPKWARYGNVVDRFDLSGLNVMVKDQASLDQVRFYYQRIKRAQKMTEEKYGKGSIYRF